MSHSRLAVIGLVALTTTEALVFVFGGANALGFDSRHVLGTGMAAAGAAVVMVGFGGVVAIAATGVLAIIRLRRDETRRPLPEAFLSAAVGISPAFLLIAMSPTFLAPLVAVEAVLLAGWKWKRASPGLPAPGLIAGVIDGATRLADDRQRLETTQLREAIAAGNTAEVDRLAASGPIGEWVAMEIEVSPEQLALWERAMIHLGGEQSECVHVIQQIAEGHPEAVDTCAACTDCDSPLRVQLALHQQPERAQKLGAFEALWPTLSVLQANGKRGPLEQIVRGARMLTPQGAFLPRLHGKDLVNLWNDRQSAQAALVASVAASLSADAALLAAAATTHGHDSGGANVMTALTAMGTLDQERVDRLLAHGAERALARAVRRRRAAQSPAARDAAVVGGASAHRDPVHLRLARLQTDPVPEEARRESRRHRRREDLRADRAGDRSRRAEGPRRRVSRQKLTPPSRGTGIDNASCFTGAVFSP